MGEITSCLHANEDCEVRRENHLVRNRIVETVFLTTSTTLDRMKLVQV